MCVTTYTHAQSINELNESIRQKRTEIEKIEKEIAQFQKELSKVGAERSTLENAIAELTITRKKLLTDITLTQRKIDQSSLAIQKLDIEINDKEDLIVLNNATIAQLIRDLQEHDQQSLVETILGSDDLTELWTEVDQSKQLQTTLQEEVINLGALRDELTDQQTSHKKEKQNLTNYQKQLEGQKQLVDNNKKEKDTLLVETKSKEENYQTLLQERIKQREQFESELKAFEAQIQRKLDPSSIPAIGKGILHWPIDESTILDCQKRTGLDNCITQYFGNTPFATNNPQVYNGKGHNGIDIAVSIGTPVKSALSGIVKGAGNTDTIPQCLSYGRWVLVEHANGLSTLYMHLSTISVKKDQQVQTGDILGLSGNSGYVVANPGGNGAHLHFTVFATNAVEIQQFTRSINCKTAVIPLPVSGFQSYLNPLSYL